LIFYDQTKPSIYQDLKVWINTWGKNKTHLKQWYTILLLQNWSFEWLIMPI